MFPSTKRQKLTIHEREEDALWGEFAAAELASAESSGASDVTLKKRRTLPCPETWNPVKNMQVGGSSSSKLPCASLPSPFQQKIAEACACGHTFQGNALVCVKCGAKHPAKATPQAYEDEGIAHVRDRKRQTAEAAVSAPVDCSTSAQSVPASQGTQLSKSARKRANKKAREAAAREAAGAEEDAEEEPKVLPRPTPSTGPKPSQSTKPKPSSAVVDLTRPTPSSSTVSSSRPTPSSSSASSSRPTPSSKPSAAGKKEPQVQWRVRNLTYEHAIMLADPSLSIATRDRDLAMHAVDACTREVRDLRVNLVALGDVRVPAVTTVELAGKESFQAQARLQEIRARIEKLSPGPELIDANAELGRAHQDAAVAEEAFQQLQRSLHHARRIEQLTSLLQHKTEDLAWRKRKVAELSLPVANLENARAPLQQELDEALRLKEELPPLVVHVCPLPELKQVMRKKSPDLRFGSLTSMIRTEWSLRLALDEKQSEDKESRGCGMLSPAALLAAFDASPKLAQDAANPVILALEARLAPEVGDGSRSVAQMSVPRTRYLLARSETIRTLREQLEKVPPLPNSLELLRASLGLVPDMWLHKVVLQACQQAFQPRCCQAPLGLEGTLRPYQARGYEWLLGNAENGFGCILADDMGLGKTLQSIALLLHLNSIGRVGCPRREHSVSSADLKPALVVAPYSVLRCWELELKRWAPSLQCYVYHGSNRKLPSSSHAVPELREEVQDPSADVFLTTYGTLQKDRHKIAGLGYSFGLILLDESQTIKNSTSLVSGAVKQIAAANNGSCRVALSGTPLENKLSELYSLFDFLNPGFLGTKAEFAANFVKPIEKAASGNKALTKRASDMKEEAIRKLKVAIGPFLLRRCKTDPGIAPELPDKVELLHVVQLGPAQRRLYAAVAEEALRKVAEKNHDFVHDGPETETAVDDHIVDLDELDDSCGDPMNVDAHSNAKRPKRFVARVLAMMHGLQQVCNHPAALPVTRWPACLQHQCELPELHRSNHQASGKTARLLELLEEILEPPRDKVLIFTQYRLTLDFLAKLVESRFPTIRAQTFHGGLTREERDAATRAFSEDPATAVMVLTLQAGGVGLTLTAASHVIHFDRCWNPAKEMQATDRAHRLGQRRTVVVHRLVTAETFEERLATVVSQKMGLASSVVGANGAQILTEYSDRQLRELFLLGGGAGAKLQSR